MSEDKQVRITKEEFLREKKSELNSLQDKIDMYWRRYDSYFKNLYDSEFLEWSDAIKDYVKVRNEVKEVEESNRDMAFYRYKGKLYYYDFRDVR